MSHKYLESDTEAIGFIDHWYRTPVQVNLCITTVRFNLDFPLSSPLMRVVYSDLWVSTI
jgi:hypothetical protein